MLRGVPELVIDYIFLFIQILKILEIISWWYNHAVHAIFEHKKKFLFALVWKLDKRLGAALKNSFMKQDSIDLHFTKLSIGIRISPPGKLLHALSFCIKLREQENSHWNKRYRNVFPLIGISKRICHQILVSFFWRMALNLYEGTCHSRQLGDQRKHLHFMHTYPTCS